MTKQRQSLDYCPNSNLTGVGEHILGVYPTRCEECQKHPSTVRRGRPKGFVPKGYNEAKYDWLPSNPGKGIVGGDVWLSGVDRARYSLTMMAHREHCDILKADKLKKTAKAKP